MTNLLGTQYDGRITDNGLTTDTTWDGVWKSAARKTETGWTAEIAIELSSLKYKPGRQRVWGLGLARIFPRRLENSFWQGLVDSPYKVSQFGLLSGLDLERASKKLQVIPHVVGKLEDWKTVGAEAGLDARYAFTQTVSGNLTVNPDFATVEADQEQINLTRFELSLPEKRNFFLEGKEIYNQRIQLFYSRRIGDIYGGAKVYGKAGGFEFSGLTAQTKPDEETGHGLGQLLRFPAEEGHFQGLFCRVPRGQQARRRPEHGDGRPRHVHQFLEHVPLHRTAGRELRGRQGQQRRFLPPPLDRHRHVPLPRPLHPARRDVRRQRQRRRVHPRRQPPGARLRPGKDLLAQTGLPREDRLRIELQHLLGARGHAEVLADRREPELRSQEQALARGRSTPRSTSFSRRNSATARRNSRSATTRASGSRPASPTPSAATSVSTSTSSRGRSITGSSRTFPWNTA